MIKKLETMAYPTFVTKGFKPFDPLALAEKTREIVCNNSARKYTNFYCTGVYGGISTGYLVGCCLRCIFCWVDLSREYPERYGEFFTPDEVVKKLIENAKRRGVKKLRISGGEPTLCKEHLLKVLDLASNTNYLFILETNGILLGADRDYVRALTKYNNLYVRISLKAGTPKGFEERTGAQRNFFELPYKAIEYALAEGLFFRVAAMSDERLMPKEERDEMIRRLKEIGYNYFLEEEVCDPYETTILRLKKSLMY